jgi:hypothetical protein
MSLLLTGAKTATIAGTPLQCLEIYTLEAYTLAIAFVDETGTPIDCTGWTLATSCKWYTADITEPETVSNTVDIDIQNIVLISPQPTTPGSLTATFTNAATGVGYLYIPTTMSGTTGLTTPGLNDTTSLLAIVTMTVTRTDPLSSLTDVNREPIGLIIRYQ